MAKDRSNMNAESITVKRPRAGKVSMALPRQDDGMVHKAAGTPLDSSAVRYADAMDGVIGGPSAAGRPAS
jgi:hypothetical protein